jgi:hypothetical protein
MRKRTDLEAPRQGFQFPQVFHRALVDEKEAYFIKA